MELPAIVTVIALLEYMFFSFQVGFGRAKYNVDAPAVTGNEEWERLFRVQQNTVEQLVIFIPALWMFSHFWGATIGAAIGTLFVIARPIYFVTYVRDPGSRAAGFVMGFLTNVVLVLGTLVGAVRGFL